MRPRLLLLLIFIFCCAAPFAMGDDDARYFSLTVNRTFAPSEKPSVQLYASGVKQLEFRIYRVQDAEKFFAQMDDIHHFGPEHSPSEQVDERTWLERFHDWKMRLWSRLRSFLRGQLSAQARHEYRADEGNKLTHTRIFGLSGFANVPLLNSSRTAARWKVELPNSTFSHSFELPIDSLSSGIYLIEATDGQYKAYTTLIVTRLAMVVKNNNGELFAFVADRQTGKPVDGAELVAWSYGKKLGEVKTASDGVAQSRLARQTAAEQSGSKNEAVWALAHKGDDYALAANYELSFTTAPERETLAYIYTDRPVYRPGDDVRFKAIVRKRDGSRLTLPGGAPVLVRIYSGWDFDSGQKLLQQYFTPDAYGAISGSIKLPPDATLDNYHIAIMKTDGVGAFQIEAYKKPEYFVRVTPKRARVLQGESTEAVIEARYFYGEPVANAKVKYSIYAERHWFNEEEEAAGDEHPTAGGGDEGDANVEQTNFYGGQVGEGEGVLDADGHLTISVPTTRNKGGYDWVYHIEASVTDSGNREVIGRNGVLATFGDFHLSIESTSYVATPGQNVTLEISAFDYDKHPVATPVVVDLYSRKGDKLGELKGATDASGRGRVSLAAAQPGDISIIARAERNGRAVEAHDWLWILGDKSDGMWMSDDMNERIHLNADKKTYRIGETARIALSGLDEGASILIETTADTVLTHQVLPVTGKTMIVEAPITADSAPNITVNAIYFKDGKLHEGSLDLKVPLAEQRLKIDIEPSKQQFEPGERVGYKVTARDAAGRPVQASLSFGVVDEALYGVEPDASGDILSALHPQRESSSYLSSLEYFFEGEAGLKSMKLAQHKFVGDRRLAQVKPGDMPAPKIRKAFPDTAYWQAQAVTGADGVANFSFAFPDSLTTWRATVRAVTADSRAGWAVHRVLVRKNLMVRLVAPRFVRPGDSVIISALTENYLPQTVTAHVSLEASGAALDGAAIDQTIASRKEGVASWTLRPNVNATQCKLTVKSLTSVESDAMELTLPVVPYGVKRELHQSGVLASGSAAAQIDFPAQDPSSRSLTIDLAPTMLGPILSSLDYLTSYPYGCTEQTLSSFVPDVVAYMALRDLKAKSPVDAATLKLQVSAGVERLKGYQHDDGGWGWWPEDESRIFMTSYAISGLTLAHDAGFNVDGAMIARGRTYLLKKFAEHPRMIADLEAYAVYALILSGRDQTDGAMINNLWSKRDKLNAMGWALMGEALRARNDGRANDVASKLVSLARTEGDGVWWSAERDELLDDSGDDSIEASAYVLRFLSRQTPNSPLLPRIVTWLMRHRNQGWYWSSTKQTAAVIYGAMEYLKATHELAAGYDVEVYINGRKALTKTFTSADAFAIAPTRLRLDASQLAQSNRIEIRKSNGGRLYWSTVGDFYTTDRAFFGKGSLALNLTREYFKLTSTRNKDNDIIYDLAPVSGALAVGDVIAVRLTLGGQGKRYLLLEDPIPAGAEHLADADRYRLRHTPGWWGYYYTRSEMRDDRASFFVEDFGGHVELFHLIKIVNPGRFRVSPATAQPMYQPDALGSSEPATLEVRQ